MGRLRASDPRSNEILPREGEQGTTVDHDPLGYSLGGEMHGQNPGRPSPRQISDMLDRDQMAQAIERALTLPLRGAPFSVEEAEGDAGEAEFVRDVLLAPATSGGMTTPIEDVIAQMTSAVSTSRAFFEKVWELREVGGQRRFVLKKLAVRPVTTCSVKKDKNGSFNGFSQKGFRTDGTKVDVTFDPSKAFVYFRGGNRRPLEGESAFNAAYHAYDDKTKVMRIWKEHLQQFALGILVGTHPKGALKKAISKFFQIIVSVRGGGRIVKSEAEKLELLQSSKTTEEFARALQYLDSQMAISVLAQFLVLGQGQNTGAWSLSRDHSDFFLQTIEADLRDMAYALTLHVVGPLVSYNFGRDAAFPRFVFQPLSENDRNRAFEVYKEIVTAASPNMDPAEKQAIKEKAWAAMDLDIEKLSEAAEGEEGDDPELPSLPANEGLNKAINRLITGNPGAAGTPAAGGS